MKKSIIKFIWLMVTCAFLMAVAIQPIGVYSTVNYDVYGHRLIRGIDNVKCTNAVDVNSYALIHSAVEAAIDDWDRHLNTLNEQYGVNWNITDVTGQPSEDIEDICFCVMTNAQVKATYGEDFFDNKDHVLAFTMLLSEDLQYVDPVQEDWYTSVIVICIEELRACDMETDFDEIKAVINHEIGHVFGLDHVDTDTDVLMFSERERCTACVPTASDLAGVYAVFAQGPVCDDSSRFDYSRILPKVFEEAYAFGEYDDLPRGGQAPYLALQTDTGESEVFEQYLRNFAKERGYCYASGTQQELLKQKILLRDDATGRLVGVNGCGVLVSVHIASLENTAYEVKVTVWASSWCSTSASILATVDPTTGDIGYTIRGKSMS